MQAEQWDRVQELLDLALELPPEQRLSYLRQQGDVDAAVRTEVESLLEHHSGAEEFLDRERLGELVPAADESIPADSIEGYRLGRVLGEGGMGLVFEAEQLEPVPRTVAIKLIKLGMDTRKVVDRFDTERQALARMSHAGIARVFDAGATRDGRPYFVMEYVDGRPITTFCDEARLTMRRRLELFLEVCAALQHAHQKGIIHRDIKPSNVLVAIEDERPLPKIIDFGIAKATDSRSDEGSPMTEVGQIVGTLAYMSPEQADLTSPDIDTRTDVYSLGVLLYELLVGALPFEPSSGAAGREQSFRQIRELDPPRPSTRFDSLGEPSNEISERRQTDPRAVIRDLRGDLDWIVMKALEKDLTRRYGSVSDLAADIRHYLAHEPVTARPPGTLYRMRKFARRNRVGVASGSLVVLALVAGIVGTSLGMLRAQRAQRAADEARQLAKSEAAGSERIAEYLVGVFEVADPTVTRANTITAREILDSKAAEIRGALEEDPGVRGRLMSAMGEAYMGLGLHNEALSLLEDGLPLLIQAHGEEDERVYDALNELGILANRIDDFARARIYLERALGIAERIKGTEHEHLPPILKNLGDVAIKLGDLEAARGYLERALEIRTARYGAESAPVAKTLSSFSKLLVRAGDHETAIEMARRSLATRQAIHAPDDPSQGHGHLALADALFAAGDHAAAREHFQSAIDNWSAALGADHESVGLVSFRLARSWLALGDRERAHEAYRRARQIEERAFDPADPRLAPVLAGSLNEYAVFLDDLGRADEAQATRVEAARILARHSLPS